MSEALSFAPTAIDGAWLVEPVWRRDERGEFARTFCAEEFRRHGLEPRLVQASLSRTRRRGTLRGMHYQDDPHAETKLVRCARGAVHDVVVDLRPASPTFRRHLAVRLDAESGLQLYVPAGCAHGFLTLEDDAEIAYAMSVPFHPESARGVRWNDPAFGIAWPFEPVLIAERDRTWPDFPG
jgi:dTDP-4-dehydrorhamnose 3,5-epimerase